MKQKNTTSEKLKKEKIMFEKASKMKLRFDTTRGPVSVEDLWDIPLTRSTGPSLDDIAKDLNRQLKAAAEESFVVKSTKPNQILQLKFDIVREIIKQKLEAQEARKEAEASKQQRELIASIIELKEVDELKEKSVKELKKLLRNS